MPARSAVAMTFLQGVCGHMAWWSALQQYPTRVFMLAPILFRLCRPRLGPADDLGELADEEEGLAGPPEYEDVV